MKKITLFRHTDDMIKEVMKGYKGCSVARTGAKEHTVTCDDKKVNTVDDFDVDGNDHITQDEVVEQVHKIAPNKSREEIISDIDTNDNGRITKGEVKDWIEKQDN